MDDRSFDGNIPRTNIVIMSYMKKKLEWEGEKKFENTFSRFDIQYTNVTDGQRRTDRQRTTGLFVSKAET